MRNHGLVRAAVAIPLVKVGWPRANLDNMLDLLDQAHQAGAEIVLFPELCLTGYTCADLFQHSPLLTEADEQLARLAKSTRSGYAGLVVVGLPFFLAGRLYNVAAVIHRGNVLGLVPKSFVPTYKEFYERRWFSAALGTEPPNARWRGQDLPFGTDLLFEVADEPHLRVGVEICEDLWVPMPPSGFQAAAGASILLNLSASNEGTGKAEYRRDLVANQSGRCVAAYLYAAAGVTESTTDLVFGGHGIIAENGAILTEAKRFSRTPQLLLADIDTERLLHDRARLNTFGDACSVAGKNFRCISFARPNFSASVPETLHRFVPAQPFVPSDGRRLADRCEEIFQTQMAGLAKRIEKVGVKSLAIGVSGGLDSTLALLVTARACDLLGLDRQIIDGVTMPGFGTSDRTRGNAHRLMELLEVRRETIDIRQLCLDTFLALGHRPFGMELQGLSVEEFQKNLEELSVEARHDLVFENVQARVRTLLLMNRGFVIGTGDLSELALGWCTYNADHMSMYNPNASIPKTLVRFLVKWVAENQFTGPTREVLFSIADTEISPELLPIRAGQIQSTESTIGPYELHDFFLYHFLRFGYGPAKILHLSRFAEFSRPYETSEIRKWLEVFLRRFFTNQYKRSCLPDGPKVGSISVSPRGDWRMPSDAEVQTWLDELARVL